jgi:hypothetical protein
MRRKTDRVLPALRRYTTLPVLLDLLKEKRLTLVSPTSWADRNDSFYLEQYKNGRRAESVLALCLSEAGETFHHWRVFTQGSENTTLLENERWKNLGRHCCASSDEEVAPCVPL